MWVGWKKLIIRLQLEKWLKFMFFFFYGYWELMFDSYSIIQKGGQSHVRGVKLNKS